MARATVHIVDDDTVMGRTLALLARSAGLEAESHESGEAFLEVFDPETTGCVVADVRMPTMSGLELQREVKARDSATAVIMITGHAVASQAVEALKHGAADFIEKPVDDDVFLAAVRQAVARTQRRAANRSAAEAAEARYACLSRREQQVMDMIVAGDSCPCVGRKLGISVRTAESHRARIMTKMGARGLADLVRQSILLSRDPEAGP